LQVKVRNGNVDKALRIFKKKCVDIVFEYRMRQFYEKPSEIKQKNKKAAVSRERRRRANAERTK
jgi:ribosomal protein S21